MAADQTRAALERIAAIEIERGMDADEAVERGMSAAYFARQALDAIDRLISVQASAQAAPEWLQQFANAVRDGIASHAADNWPTRKFSLQEIENGIGAIEINAAMVYAAIRTPSTAGGGVGEAL